MSLLFILDMIGTVAFAASGAWVGVRKEMDLFGVVSLGMVTAIGGGTLRDLLLGDLPPFCLQNEIYFWVPAATAVLVFVMHRHLPNLMQPLLYLDAIGLGTFVVIGVSKALLFETGPFGAVLMGVLTGTAGGVIRDILANEVPLILRQEIYASACIFGGIMLVILTRLEAPEQLNLLLVAGSVILIRVLAIHRNWSLPKARTVQ
ncbi:MAG: trimeric intracellular cation channel family protein [Desulfuromonadales bacterium]|nr:trimeric intracellular cation channel family protein [Desulfuromonadales bacterium]